MKIHQLLPTFAFGDAIGNHTIEIQRILRRWGHESHIYADDIHDAVRSLAKPYRKLRGRALQDALLIYHFSIGADMSEDLKRLPNKKILIYHNITPPDFLRGYDAYITDILQQGRDELRLMVGACDLALGDSEFNRQELQEMGFPATDVLPIILDFDKYSSNPDQRLLTRYQGDGARNILFVGRIVPNKCQEDILLAFAVYHKYVNPKSRLFLVGMRGIERYDFMLDEIVRRLELEDAVHFTKHVTDSQLAAYYQLADLLLCMSEHEGFSVPLLEAMHLGIPILAYNSTSIPHTLDGSGVLFNEKRYEEIAEMMDMLMENQEFRTAIVAKQRRRLEHFKKPRLEGLLKGFIEGVLR